MARPAKPIGRRTIKFVVVDCVLMAMAASCSWIAFSAHYYLWTVVSVLYADDRARHIIRDIKEYFRSQNSSSQ